MTRSCLLPACCIALNLIFPPAGAQETSTDPYAYTRRLNMLSAAEEAGRYFHGFAEDHGQQPPAAFYVLSGRWIVGTGSDDSRLGDHHVAQVASSATYSLLERDFLVVQNCRVDVSIEAESGSLARAAGIYFHRMDGPAFTLVELDWKDNKVAVYTWDGTSERLLASAPFAGWKGAWHRLTVEVEGRRVSVRVKGQRVLSASLPYDDTAGFLGLLTQRDTTARFDNLVIQLHPKSKPRRPRPDTTDP